MSRVVKAIEDDPSVDSKNIFAIEYSGGDYWAYYLAETEQIIMGQFAGWVAHFEIGRLARDPVLYFSKTRSPDLKLYSTNDTGQKYKYA